MGIESAERIVVALLDHAVQDWAVSRLALLLTGDEKASRKQALSMGLEFVAMGVTSRGRVDDLMTALDTIQGSFDSGLADGVSLRALGLTGDAHVTLEDLRRLHTVARRDDQLRRLVESRLEEGIREAGDALAGFKAHHEWWQSLDGE